MRFEGPSFGHISVPLAGGGGSLSVCIRGGAGPTLVLLHGLTDCADSFRLLAPHLPGYRLIAPDLRGHGRSVRTGDLTLPTFADDLSQVMDRLELGDVTIVGHSMGAMIATELAALRRDTVGRLVLLAGSLRPSSPALRALRARVAALTAPLSPGDPFFADWHHCVAPVSRRFLDRLARSAATISLSDWLMMIEMIAALDRTAHARQIDLPVLALSGRQDPLFPPDHLELVAGTFPDCTAMLVESCGHNPHWEEPETVADAIRTFIAQPARPLQAL